VPHLGTDRDAARDRVPLLVRPALELGAENVGLQGAKLGVGQDVWEKDEAVAVELRAKLGGKVAGEARPAAVGERMGDLLSPRVQPGAVEPPRPEDRIVGKAFGTTSEGGAAIEGKRRSSAPT
jgi:hypothetical protein